MNEYTPGPWFVDPDDRPGMSWNNHILCEGDPNLAICFMTHDGTKENLSGIANANLVAAAPELLEALILCRSELMGADLAVESKTWKEGICRAIHDADAAIAKARGNSTDR